MSYQEQWLKTKDEYETAARDQLYSMFETWAPATAEAFWDHSISLNEVEQKAVSALAELIRQVDAT
jgi:hypothetical protein